MTENFDNLFYNEDEFNKEILNDILEGRVKLSKSGTFRLVENEDTKDIILLYLLANKVMVLKDIKENEKEGPKKIHENTQIAEGTVNRYVTEMEDKGLLEKKENGKYFVPDYLLPEIKERFEEKQKND